MKLKMLLTLTAALGLFLSVSCSTKSTTTEASLAACQGGSYVSDLVNLTQWQDNWFKNNTALTGPLSYGTYCIDNCNRSAGWQDLVGCISPSDPLKCNCADDLSTTQNSALIAKCENILKACVQAKVDACTCGK